MADPNEAGGLSITLKQDGRDGMWTVFHGSPARIREDIIETFGLDTKSYEEYTLYDLALEAQRLYRGLGNVSTILGAKPVTSADEPVAGSEKPETTPSSPPWDTGEANPLVALIEGSESVSELQDIYKRNVDEFKSNKNLLTAWKNKGKALKASA